MMNTELLADLQRCRELPSIPSVAAEVIALARDPDADLSAVAQTLGKDPAMASKLLRRANSPYYARVQAHSSVISAVRFFGIRDSLTIALNCSLVDSLRARKVHSLDYAWFWRRALLSSVYARNLAKQRGGRDAEEASLTALLQDIGMMALDQVAPHLYKPIAHDCDYHYVATQIEQTVVGINHAAISTWLLAQWGFPQSLIQAVSRSHCITQPDELGHSNEFERTIMLSGAMADMWLNPSREEQLDQISALAGSLLGLSDREVGQVIKSAGPDVDEIGTLFSIALTDPAETQQLLDAASRLME